MQVNAFRPSHLFGAIGAVILGVALLSWAPWSAQARDASTPAARASNVSMNCAPGQQALVHQTVVNGELNVGVECAGGAIAAPAAYQSEFERPIAAPAVTAVPAVYRPVAAPVQEYAPRPAVRTRPAPVRRAEPRRDWKRETMIIGGSAGAGAGIGGLIGGKKGALIGAAIGGGSAALYRATK